MGISTEQLSWARAIAVYAVVLVVVGLIVFLPMRIRFRGVRWRRLADRFGLTWLGRRDDLLLECRDLACLHTADEGRVLHCMEGARGGRRFVVFDYHHALPRLARDGSAGMGALLLFPIQFFLLFTVDRARDPGFSAAIVACPLPPGVKTVEAKRALRPWVVEFGADGSVIRPESGYVPLADLIDAVDRLNAALDRIAGDAQRAVA